MSSFILLLIWIITAACALLIVESVYNPALIFSLKDWLKSKGYIKGYDDRKCMPELHPDLEYKKESGKLLVSKVVHPNKRASSFSVFVRYVSMNATEKFDVSTNTHLKSTSESLVCRK